MIQAYQYWNQISNNCSFFIKNKSFQWHISWFRAYDKSKKRLDMLNSIKRIPSGFSLIDRNWNGIYRGGSYLIVGPRKSGRTLLGLQFALEAAKASEVCLYFTPMRPKDLMIQAASLNFDIQAYMNQNLIIVVRIAPPDNSNDKYHSDDYLVEYFNDIIALVDQYNPSRIIFDELTPFVGFRSLDYLLDTFLSALETIEERNIASLFVISEPATQKTRSIVKGLSTYVTGVIKLKKDFTGGERHQGGIVTISPNVGHNEGEFTSEYRIEPYKGVTTEFSREREMTNEFAATLNKTRTMGKSIDEDISYDTYASSNVYSLKDFYKVI